MRAISNHVLQVSLLSASRHLLGLLMAHHRYVYDVAATRKSLTDDGFFKTGDVAEEVNGLYYIKGRSSIDSEYCHSFGLQTRALNVIKQSSNPAATKFQHSTLSERWSRTRTLLNAPWCLWTTPSWANALRWQWCFTTYACRSFSLLLLLLFFPAAYICPTLANAWIFSNK